MSAPWRILIVEDEQDIAEGIRDLIEPTATIGGARPSIEIESNFALALDRLHDMRFDLLVLDVRDQGILDQPGSSEEEADRGITTFDDVRRRQFVPIIFHTAIPDHVAHLVNSPFVQLVSKNSNDSPQELRAAVTLALDSGIPTLNRALVGHVEKVTRDFMVDFVEQNWEDLGVHPADLAHLLLRRLAVSLDDGAGALATALGLDGADANPQTVHGTRYYVLPPVGDVSTGEVLRGPQIGSDGPATGSDEAEPSWYVVLTPACDLVAGRVKADFIVVATCVAIETIPEGAALAEAVQDGADPGVGSARKKLAEVLRSRKPQEDRYFYLPNAWRVPDLLVDLQQITHVRYADLEKYERVASLDSPYAEALAHRLNRYIGRLGTPDLDLDASMDRMVAAMESTSE